MIASDLIYQAFRRCGQMRPGYTPQAELMADGLAELKALYDGWNAERTLNYSMPDYVFPVTGPGHGATGNAQTFGGTGYTIGPSGADFTAPRPESIVRANLYMTSTSPTQPTRIPLSPISMEQWMNISVIQLTPINVTTVFCYDPQYPNGVIWVWPPLNGNSLEIFTWGQLIPPATLGATWVGPPGYQDAVRDTLAERLLPLCTHDIMPSRRDVMWLRGQAAIGRQKIKAVNAPSPRLKSDFPKGGQNGKNSCDWGLLLTGEPS